VENKKKGEERKKEEERVPLGPSTIESANKSNNSEARPKIKHECNGGYCFSI
jgi:hypothetical protein